MLDHKIHLVIFRDAFPCFCLIYINTFISLNRYRGMPSMPPSPKRDRPELNKQCPAPKLCAVQQLQACLHNASGECISSIRNRRWHAKGHSRPPHPDASHDLHLALPSPDVAPPELVFEEFMFAMLSLAASCARLGLPCLAAVVLGCCIVGRPLKFD